MLRLCFWIRFSGTKILSLYGACAGLGSIHQPYRNTSAWLSPYLQLNYHTEISVPLGYNCVRPLRIFCKITTIEIFRLPIQAQALMRLTSL